MLLARRHPVRLVKELLRQLEMRQMLTRVTVTVEEPEQPRPGRSIPDSIRPNSQSCEVLVGDLRSQFLEQPIRGIDSPQEFLGILDARREL
jgi:hypothetical protein